MFAIIGLIVACGFGYFILLTIVDRYIVKDGGITYRGLIGGRHVAADEITELAIGYAKHTAHCRVETTTKPLLLSFDLHEIGSKRKTIDVLELCFPNLMTPEIREMRNPWKVALGGYLPSRKKQKKKKNPRR